MIPTQSIPRLVGGWLRFLSLPAVSVMPQCGAEAAWRALAQGVSQKNPKKLLFPGKCVCDAGAGTLLLL